MAKRLRRDTLLFQKRRNGEVREELSHAYVTDRIADRVENEAQRCGCSKSFVQASILGAYFGLAVEDYRTAYARGERRLRLVKRGT